jgi:hypothetical protein
MLPLAILLDIPGRAKREPGISMLLRADPWIPGLRLRRSPE